LSMKTRDLFFINGKYDHVQLNGLLRQFSVLFVQCAYCMGFQTSLAFEEEDLVIVCGLCELITVTPDHKLVNFIIRTECKKSTS